MAERKDKGQNPAATGYSRHRDAAGRRQAAQSASGRDIGSIPPPVDQKRRDGGERDLRWFCEKYFPERFNLAWSDDQLRVIGEMQRCVLHGGLLAMAMPRGSGKTSIVEVAIVWATLYGHRRMVAGLGATRGKGLEILDSIKTELECNDRLADDFPEVCLPIRALEGITNRCAGQTCCGERTRISWTVDKVILPTIAGSAASGTIVKVGGLTGGDVRGMKHTREDGNVVRPDFVMIDDPQTDKTAASPAQNRTREHLLSGAVLGMAGPGKRIAAVMPCTVIEPGDMADNILDRDKHPEWNGVRTKMVYAWPANEKLWDEYARLRGEGLRAGDDGAAATEFYRTNRAAMDVGAKVAWEARFDPNEISALQHAMNLRLRDEAVFFAEYQNEPMVEAADEDLPDADAIAAKLNHLQRRAIPTACNHLTAFCDVHDRVVWWMVVAWEESFTGYVIDYGAYPDQRKSDFIMRTATRTLGRVFQGAGREGAIFAGLQAITDELLARQWRRDDGTLMQIGALLIDKGWETDVVHKFIRQSTSPVVWPAKGLRMTASSTPWEERKPQTGERQGHHWRIAPIRGQAKGRHVLSDVNYWKSFVMARFAVAMGDPGCLSLFGARPERHRMLAAHLTAEYRVRTEGRGRMVDEWKETPGRPDNHLLDCLVGCAVGASMLGCVLPGMQGGPRRKGKRRRRRKNVDYL